MNCIQPFIVHSDNGDFKVRCGHCLNCKIQYANVWATRILHESLFYPFSSFVTLTYSDEYNPFELSIDVAQRWQKRLRTQYKRKGHNDTLKFFTAGEYGQESALIDGIGRPHYHSIVFGLNPYSDESYELIKSTWEYQDYDVLKRQKIIGDVTYNSARYVSQYILKKYYDDQYINKVYGDMQQPFRIMSKGIGKRYALKYKEEIENNDNMIYSGNGKAKIALPQYYKNFIETTPDLEHVLTAIKNQTSYKENLIQEKKAHDRQLFFSRGNL